VAYAPAALNPVAGLILTDYLNAAASKVSKSDQAERRPRALRESGIPASTSSKEVYCDWFIGFLRKCVVMFSV
jgi:hypothetical protein